jgi:16S rRNA (uracil1498-N3)-methyltransferase
MTRRRFYAPPSAFSDGNIILQSEEARHLKDVLRLRVMDEVFVFNGEGSEFKCRIDRIGKHETQLSLIEEVSPSSPESTLELTLAIALMKGEKLDLVIQKSTELGVKRFLLVESEHADVKVRTESDLERRMTRLRRIALEAAKQSGRARLPQIDGPVKLDRILEAHDSGLRLFFSERGGERLDVSASPGITITVTAVIGPEGGWSIEELETAKQRGWNIITLGGRVLRAETAAIAVAAILQHLFGDLR